MMEYDMNIELTEEQKVKVFSPRDLYPVMREVLTRESEIDQLKEQAATTH